MEELLEFSSFNMTDFNGSLNGTIGVMPPKDNWWFQLFVQILYGIVCVVGLCGNTLVIYVVYRFSKMKTVTNLYIVNLAIADECFLVGIPFLIITASIGYWPFGNLICKVYMTTTSINQFTSSMFLLIMSADRYLAVCHPIDATKYRTPLFAKLVALTAWSLSAIFMTPIFIYTYTDHVEFNEGLKETCNIFWPDAIVLFDFNGSQTFVLYIFIFGFAIPLVLIMIFYVLVILKLRTVGPKRNHKKLIPNGATNEERQAAKRAKERKKSHRRVTKLVLTVITVYLICWLPYWISQLMLNFSSWYQTSKMAVPINFLVGCLSYSNSAMNPILYAFLSENFKKSFLKACTCTGKKDVNSALQVENSIFPKRKSEARRKRQNRALSTSRIESNAISNTPLPKTEDEFDSDDEEVAIPKKSDLEISLMPKEGENLLIATQEILNQDGIHVTAL